MTAWYFGVECPICSIKVPIGAQRDEHPVFSTSGHVLDCPVCKTESLHRVFSHWGVTSPYTPEDLRAGQSYIQAVSS